MIRRAVGVARRVAGVVKRTLVAEVRAALEAPADPVTVRQALVRRLEAAADARDLDVAVLPRSEDPAVRAATLLVALVADAREAPTAAPTWLLLAALTGSLPLTADVAAARRRFQLAAPHDDLSWLLDRTLGGSGFPDPLVELDVVRRGVVIDVDYTARHDLNTGIQRVVRRTVPAWLREHDATLVAWTAGTAMRGLVDAERRRVLAWSGPLLLPPTEPPVTRVVVPWESVVVLPEVPAPRLCGPLAALAEHSGNATTVIGYDCIPVVSADLMPPVEPERFARYLTVVKHSTRVSAISASAAEEFSGFTDMLGSQGLTGPTVTSCLLPVEVPETVASTSADGVVPLVVSVGSHEPRKNHLAVLHAAERLWREGARFRLQFIGGSSWASDAFDTAVEALRSAGRDVVIGRAVHDSDLWDAYRAARFTVAPSLHEGFGLPVAESLGVGTPVVTSAHGSMRELGQGGGVLLVDPRSDDELLAAMRRLLADDELRDRLSAEALARPVRTWDDYARESWEQLVAGVGDPTGAADPGKVVR